MGLLKVTGLGSRANKCVPSQASTRLVAKLKPKPTPLKGRPLIKNCQPFGVLVALTRADAPGKPITRSVVVPVELVVVVPPLAAVVIPLS